MSCAAIAHVQQRKTNEKRKQTNIKKQNKKRKTKNMTSSVMERNQKSRLIPLGPTFMSLNVVEFVVAFPDFINPQSILNDRCYPFGLACND